MSPWRMMRRRGRWVSLALIFLLSACSDSGDSLFEIKRAQEGETPPDASAETVPEEAVVVEPPKPFVIYHTIDPVPEKLVQGWLSETGVDWPVEQRLLPADMEALPEDGDFYVVTPQWIPRLQATLTLADFEASPLMERVNPTFSGFPFDPQNRISIPWRWTPYALVAQPPEGGSPVAAWSEAEGCHWPGDPVLRAAAWRREQGVSANAFQRVAPAPGNPAHYPGWEEIRTRWRERDFVALYIPAAWWMKDQPLQRDGDAEAAAPDPVRLVLSAQGALLHFEHLAVPAERERVTAARALAGYLLGERAQQWLLPYTGYFPVVSPLSREMEGSTLPVKNEQWLDHCEFPLAPPAYRQALPIPAPEEPADETAPLDDDPDAESPPPPAEKPEKPMIAPLDQIPLDPPLGI